MAQEHVITTIVGNKSVVIGTAKSKKEAHALTSALRKRGNPNVFTHKTSDYKKFIDPKYQTSSVAQKAATAVKTIQNAGPGVKKAQPRGGARSGGSSGGGGG